MTFPERIVTVARALAAAKIPHAFGGAIALAYCIPEPRATVDMDINIFLPTDEADRALAALPPLVQVDLQSRAAIDRDGQVRLWWEHTPVDLFFNTTPFHEDAALRSRREPFGSIDLPVLACSDLAVFKAFFNRGKDWVDLEAMLTGGALDIAGVAGVLVELLGADDARVSQLLALQPQRLANEHELGNPFGQS